MNKVYLISAGDYEEDKRYKIGYTKRKVLDRIKDFKTGNSQTFEVICEFESIYATQIESALHKKYYYSRIEGEWFILSAAEISEFKEACKFFHDTFELLKRENTWVQARGGWI